MEVPRTLPLVHPRKALRIMHTGPEADTANLLVTFLLLHPAVPGVAKKGGPGLSSFAVFFWGGLGGVCWF